MIQTVYVLEILRAGETGELSTVRGHFAQTQGAAQRAAAGKYRLSGRWEDVQETGDPARRVVSRLLGPGGEERARVVKEGLEYG